jgi:hypothetical protein
MFGPLAWRFRRRPLRTMHDPFGPPWHVGPHWGAWGHGGHSGCGHHHGPDGPSREEVIAHLGQYQRALEEATIAVATRLKELRAAGAPATPATPGTAPGARPG